MTGLKLRHKFHMLFAGRGQSEFAPDPKQQEATAASLLRDQLRDLLAVSGLRVASFFRDWIRIRPSSGGRCRDLFPIPPLTVWPSCVPVQKIDAGVCLDVSNMCIGALNFLNAGFKPAFTECAMRKLASTAQSSSQRHICRKVVRYLSRLDEQLGHTLPWHHSFQQCERSTMPCYEDIRCDLVDLPAQAASCDPSRLICEGLRRPVSSASVIFPHGAACAPLTVPREKRAEYLKLTCMELACGKLRLRRQVSGIGGVSAVAKRGGRQCKVWDGGALSETAAAPPKPRRLANRSCFLDVQLHFAGS